MRFLHTADWHLGRLFHSFSLLDDQKHLLDQLVDIAVARNVDAVLVAGDVYDRSVPPSQAVKVLDDALNRLCQDANIPVILIPGNHDGADRLGFGSRQLQSSGLHIIASLDQVTKPVVIRSGSEECHFYGIPYAEPVQVGVHMSQKFNNHDAAHTALVNQIISTRSADVPSVLISHCFVAGSSESDSERALSVGGADQVSWEPMSAFHYVALGHLHNPQRRGLDTIRYSGSLMKYSFSEHQQMKGVVIVELDKQGQAKTEFVALTPLRDVRVIEGLMEEVIAGGQADEKSDDYVMVRLTDKNAILDAMSKLRASYPNILHLEKPGITAIGERKSVNPDHLRRGDLSMFSDFFLQMTGDELSKEQEKIISNTLDSLRIR